MRAASPLIAGDTGRVAGTLPAVSRWRGRVVLAEDVLVPPGARLTVEAGTRIAAEYEASPGLLGERFGFGERRALESAGRCHLIVAGRLDVEGSAERPVSIASGSWGGIFVLDSGRAFLRHAELAPVPGGFGVKCLDFGRLRASFCRFSGGEGGVACGAFAAASLRDCSFSGAGRAAVWVHDDARAALARCSISGSRTGLVVQGLGRLRLRGNRIAGNERGALFSDWARVRGSSQAWEDNATAISLQGGARLSLSRDLFRANDLGLECLGNSRALLDGVSAEANVTAVWSQNEASLSLDRSAFSRNDVGLRGSHRTRLRVADSVFAGHRKAGMLVEDRAGAVVKGASFQRNLNGLMALHRSGIDARRCRLSGSRDTAVWRDHRARARLANCDFRDNFRDAQSAARPAE
ncbi:MAG: right-handed parallel beta-helix repeat-containing protein [Elusimicrobiota bacterium]